MKTKNLSVSSFAKDCGISITTLKKALSGSNQVSTKTLFKIFNTMGVTIKKVKTKNRRKAYFIFLRYASYFEYACLGISSES